VAPSILSTVPTNNATDVPRNTTFAITFSEPMAATSITASTVLWKRGTTPVVWTRSVSGTTVTLTSAFGLAVGAAYTVEVTSGVTDASGNGVQPRTFTFMTVDDEAPTVVSTVPAQGAVDVARDAPVVLTFSEPVAPGSVTASTITWQQGATPVLFTIAVGVTVVTLTPTVALAPSAIHTVRVTTGVEDLAGNPLAALEGRTFWTLDDVPPTFPSAPADAGEWTTTAVHFGWDDATDVGSGFTGGYSVRVNTSPTDVGAFPTFDVPFNLASFDANDPVDFPEGTVLYAQVMAVDVAGNATWSLWSDGITIDRNPPVQPLAPLDPGTWQAGSSITFVWDPTDDAVSGVESYEIQVATSSDGVNGLLTPANVTGTSYLFPGALDGTTYYARVAAIDRLGQASDYGPFSDGITVDSTYPGTPGTPDDGGAYTANTTLTFTWSAPAEPPVIVSYVVEIGTAPGANDVATISGIAVTTATHDVGAAGTGTTYFARVAAVDGLARQGGWSNPSDGLTLDIVSSPPSVPGTPQDRGATDDTTVTFTWAPATDLQSGIQLYAVRITDGTNDYNLTTPDPFLDFDATGLVGATLQAQVQARNGAGTWGAWSALSDGVGVELSPPSVTMSSPGDGWTSVGRNTDIVLSFSEPMNPASVEGALSVSWSGGSPVHGLGFYWDPSGTRLTVMPDTADPAGITNVDLLPGGKLVTVTLGAGAADAAGNPLPSPYASSFTTAEETPPHVASITVGGTPSPFPAASVQGGFVLVVTFDEDMSSTRGGIRLDTRNGGIEGRYSDWSANVQGAVAAGGQVTYTLFGTSDIRPGDRITVQGTSPSSYDVARAPVLSVGNDGSGNLTFTVAHTAAGSYSNGGWVYFPNHGEAGIAWTGPRTLELTLPPYVSLSPGGEARVNVSNANDLEGNYLNGGDSTTVQVRSLPGTDTDPPVLASAAPFDGATGVKRYNPVILRFNEALDAATLGGCYAVDGAGNPYEMSYSSDEMGPAVLFVPLAAPSGGTRVDVHVPGVVRDLAGNLLGTPIDLSFDVASRTDFAAPELFEALPADLVPVDQIWQASAVFSDALTGRLELLGARSAGDEDLFVVDGDTALPIRGYRGKVGAGTGVLEIQSPPRGPGFSTNQKSSGFSGATAAAGVATYTTSGDHGMTVGTLVSVYSMSDGCFNASSVAVTAIPSASSFTLPTSCGDGASASGGWAQWSSPRTLVVTLAVPAVQGGTGITDFEGNPMAAASFTALLTPPGANRFPLLDSLRDLRIGVSTSPSGRQLSASFRVRDADDDTVDVSITALGGSVALVGPTPVGGTAWGSEFRLDDGGSPAVGDNPPGMGATNFPSSGYYTFEVTLDDGHGGVSTYVRDVWVWAPADVPANVSVDDGATVRPVSSVRPVVVENVDTPVLRWSGVDTVNADFLVFQFLELNAMSVGDNSSGPQGLPLSPSVTSASLPNPVEPTLYAWFVNEMKFMSGDISPESQGWSLDLGDFYRSAFVYGPANRSLDARGYGAARTGYTTQGAPGVAVGTAASGTYGLEAATGGDAPVFVDEAMTRNDGTVHTGQELFAAGSDGGFMVTTTPTAGMTIPLANRGFVGAGGRFFAVAGQDPSSISLEVGAWRDPAISFGPDLDGTTFGFVQFQIRMEVDLSLQSTEASVGQAVAGPTTLAVTGKRHDGSDLDTGGPVAYTLEADGLLTMSAGGPVAGYLGGSPGALMGGLAQQANATDTFSLVIVQKHAGPFPADPSDLLLGTYRFVEYTAGHDGAGGPGETHASTGTMTFDGDGGFTYLVSSWGQIMTGSGTYSVDPATGTVSALADPATNPTSFLLQIGVGAETLVGASVDAARPNTPQILILGR
jgi:hypothetical protein